MVRWQPPEGLIRPDRPPGWWGSLGPREQAAWIMRAVGAALVIGSVVLFALHPSVSLRPTYVYSSACISPWNQFTGHGYIGRVPPGWTYYEWQLATVRCNAAITGRVHEGWLLLILGFIVIAASFAVVRWRGRVG